MADFNYAALSDAEIVATLGLTMDEIEQEADRFENETWDASEWLPMAVKKPPRRSPYQIAAAL